MDTASAIETQFDIDVGALHDLAVTEKTQFENYKVKSWELISKIYEFVAAYQKEPKIIDTWLEDRGLDAKTGPKLNIFGKAAKLATSYEVDGSWTHDPSRVSKYASAMKNANDAGFTPEKFREYLAECGGITALVQIPNPKPPKTPPAKIPAPIENAIKVLEEENKPWLVDDVSLKFDMTSDGAPQSGLRTIAVTLKDDGTIDFHGFTNDSEETVEKTMRRLAAEHERKIKAAAAGVLAATKAASKAAGGGKSTKWWESHPYGGLIEACLFMKGIKAGGYAVLAFTNNGGTATFWMTYVDQPAGQIATMTGKAVPDFPDGKTFYILKPYALKIPTIIKTFDNGDEEQTLPSVMSDLKRTTTSANIPNYQVDHGEMKFGQFSIPIKTSNLDILTLSENEPAWLASFHADKTLIDNWLMQDKLAGNSNANKVYLVDFCPKELKFTAINNQGKEMAYGRLAVETGSHDPFKVCVENSGINPVAAAMKAIKEQEADIYANEDMIMFDVGGRKIVIPTLTVGGFKNQKPFKPLG